MPTTFFDKFFEAVHNYGKPNAFWIMTYDQWTEIRMRSTCGAPVHLSVNPPSFLGYDVYLVNKLKKPWEGNSWLFADDRSLIREMSDPKPRSLNRFEQKGKEILLDGRHFADAVDEHAAEFLFRGMVMVERTSADFTLAYPEP